MKIVRALAVSFVTVSSLWGVEYTGEYVPSVDLAEWRKSKTDQSPVVSNENSALSAPVTSLSNALPSSAATIESNAETSNQNASKFPVTEGYLQRIIKQFSVLSAQLSELRTTFGISHNTTNVHIGQVVQEMKMNRLFTEALVNQNEIQKNNIQDLKKMVEELQQKNRSNNSTMLTDASSYFWYYAKPTAALTLCSFLVYKIYQKYSAKEAAFSEE
jgi:hypothetical protein